MFKTTSPSPYPSPRRGEGLFAVIGNLITPLLQHSILPVFLFVTRLFVFRPSLCFFIHVSLLQLYSDFLLLFFNYPATEGYASLFPANTSEQDTSTITIPAIPLLEIASPNTMTPMAILKTGTSMPMREPVETGRWRNAYVIDS